MLCELQETKTRHRHTCVYCGERYEADASLGRIRAFCGVWGAGDWLARLFRSWGIAHCGRCASRSQMINRWLANVLCWFYLKI